MKLLTPVSIIGTPMSKFQAAIEDYGKNSALLCSSVVDPNTLNLDPDPGFWPNLDPDPG